MHTMIVTRIYAHATLSFDNEIRLFDACTAIATALQALGRQALDTGDLDPLKGTYQVLEDEDGEAIGAVEIREEES